MKLKEEKMTKKAVVKRSAKEERERQVLLGLVDYYLRHGTPVGSKTLKEAGFEGLSSATIRNYFAHLDNEGYLEQLHASGGRVPTDKAYRVYAEEFIDAPIIDKEQHEIINTLKEEETREIFPFLIRAAETLSELSHLAVFMSAPRFDHDFVIEVKLVMLDVNRCLCVVITNFGVIQSEVLHSKIKLSAHRTKRIENYFHARLTGIDLPEDLEEEEKELAKEWYSEVMVRYIVGYTNFTDEEVVRAGFSQLLKYPDFDEVADLTNALSLFENTHNMRLLLKDTFSHDAVKFWIGNDLKSYTPLDPNCSVIAIPYKINQKPVGAIGIMGPMRIPYRTVFGLLHQFSECMTEVLTRSLYKYQISFRQPMEKFLHLPHHEKLLLEHDS